MTIDYKNILTLMLAKRKDICPVPKNKLMDLITTHSICLFDGYMEFLLTYGNSEQLLNPSGQYANFTFLEFQDFYLDTDLFEELSLPALSNYIGIGFGGECLCIDHQTGTIQPFYYGKKDKVCYRGLDGLLFHCLISSSEYMVYFDDKQEFALDNQFLDFEIFELRNIYARYFIYDNSLLILNRHSNNLIFLKGGIMTDL